MENKQKFLQLLASFDTAMLVTKSSSEQLSARPMAIAKVESNGDLWFVTDHHSKKVNDLVVNPLVVVTMQSGNQYLALSGEVKVCSDQKKLGELWKESWKVWFPAGKTDPSLTLLHIVPGQGEYWDLSGLEGLKYLFKAGKAYLQGVTPNDDEHTHAKVSMESTWIE